MTQNQVTAPNCAQNRGVTYLRTLFRPKTAAGMSAEFRLSTFKYNVQVKEHFPQNGEEQPLQTVTQNASQQAAAQKA